MYGEGRAEASTDAVVRQSSATSGLACRFLVYPCTERSIETAVNQTRREQGVVVARATGGYDERTKGEVEAGIAEALVALHREIWGRGPDECRVHIVRDLILVHGKNLLTKSECELARTPEGQELVRRIRLQLLSQARGKMDEVVARLTGCATLSLFADVDPVSGNGVCVFALDRNLEERFAKPNSPIAFR